MVIYHIVALIDGPVLNELNPAKKGGVRPKMWVWDEGGWPDNPWTQN